LLKLIDNAFLSGQILFHSDFLLHYVSHNLGYIPLQDTEELYHVRKNKYRDVRDLHLDNLAALLFYEESKADEEPVIAGPEYTAEEQRLADAIKFK